MAWCLTSQRTPHHTPETRNDRRAERGAPGEHGRPQRPRDLELGTCKTVKARFWPWLEPFSSGSPQHHSRCCFSARQRSHASRLTRNSRTNFPTPYTPTPTPPTPQTPHPKPHTQIPIPQTLRLKPHTPKPKRSQGGTRRT